MESSYQKLKNMVESGEVEITYIDAVPRTVSSAFFRSLSHLYDASAYEPFRASKDREGNIEDTFTFLLQKTKEVQSKFPKKRPVKLLVKENARQVTGKICEEWMPLVSDFVIITRDPHLQFWSQMTRMANDIHYGKPGADGLNEDEASALHGQVAQLLKDGGSIGNLNVPRNFEKTSWKAQRNHLPAINEQIALHSNKSLTVVDGTLLRADPIAIMPEILQRLHLSHSDGDIKRITQEWDTNTSENLTRGTPDLNNAYRKRAIESTGFQPPLERTPTRWGGGGDYQPPCRSILIPRPCRPIWSICIARSA